MITKAYIFLGLIATLLSGCHRAETEKKEEITKFEATTPLRQDTSVTKEYVCQIHAIRHIEVRALERGYVQGIFDRSHAPAWERSLGRSSVPT